MEAPPIEKIIKKYKKRERRDGEEPLRESHPSNPQERVLEENRIERSSKLGGGENITEFIEIEDDGEGVYKPGYGERVGTPEKGQGYKRERAVYLVDAFLGFGLVPPTVIRTIDGEEGSLQEFISGAKTWAELKDEKPGAGLMKQAGKMMVLDILTGNKDRHSGNFLVDEGGKLWAIDNADTFSMDFAPKTFMRGLKMGASDFTYDDETVQKLRELGGDKGKKQTLFNLLLEMLGKKEVALFFKRLEFISDVIGSKRLSRSTLEIMEHELSLFNSEYDREILVLIESSELHGLTQQKVAERLLEEGQAWAVGDNLRRFKTASLNSKIAYGLIEANECMNVPAYLDRFKGTNYEEMALKLIEAGAGGFVALDINRFKDAGHEKIVDKFLEVDYDGAMYVARGLEKFNIDHNKFMKRLIDAGEDFVIETHIKNFKGLNSEVAKRLYEEGMGYIILESRGSFKDLDQLDQEILDGLRELEEDLKD